MRKLFLVLVAIFFMATSAYALNETDNGPQNITVCWATGTTDMTSGNVVILQTTSPTYWGREVTGTTTEGLKPYGIVVDGTSYSGAEMSTGKWIRVQTYGYCPIVRLSTIRAVTANSSHLITSSQLFRVSSHNEYNSRVGNNNGGVTGNSVALESLSGRNAENQTFKAWLGW